MLISDETKVIYFSVLVLLLILIIWYIRPSPEYLSSSDSEQIYTSGASMRVIGQVFAASDEAPDDRMYNELRKIPGQSLAGRGAAPISTDKKVSGIGFTNTKVPNAVFRQMASKKERFRAEHLVNEHGFPDFWETNSTLNAFHDEMINA